MSIYKFRVLLESGEVIFRDIEIKSTQNFDDLHQIILAAFGFDNSQMAAFYISNENWEKGQEITLFDMQIEESESGQEKLLVMSETAINSQTNCIGSHILYAYDFLNMHNFFIELIEITVKEEANAFYPKVVHSQGEIPVQKESFDEMSEEEMASELLKEAGFSEDGDDPSDDIFEGFDDFENYQ